MLKNKEKKFLLLWPVGQFKTLKIIKKKIKTLSDSKKFY